MLQKVFIPSDTESRFSARLAKYAIERKLSPGSSIKVEIIPDSPSFSGRSLARFSAPERMAYTGTALVVTPSIFAVQDITPLLTLDLGDNRVAAVKGNNGWDTSLLLVDAEKLRDWKMKDFLQALETDQVNIEQILDLSIEPDVLELPRLWNSLDKLTPETKMLHLKNPSTFPWKTGLPITALTQNRKFFGIELGSLEKLFSKSPALYEKHPDKKINEFFIDLMRGAYKAGSIDDAFITAEIEAGRIRRDLPGIIKE